MSLFNAPKPLHFFRRKDVPECRARFFIALFEKSRSLASFQIDEHMHHHLME